MKKTLILAFLTIFFLTIPLASFASRRSDIEDALDYWIQYADDENFEVLDTDIDMLSEDEFDIYYTITLDPGSYAFVAQTGEDIPNIDMAAFYEDDYNNGEDPFITDTFDDNYPVLEFDLDRTETIIVELWVVDWARRSDDGYYCILFAGDVDSGSDDNDHGGK
jgi:hypothetical protein